MSSDETLVWIRVLVPWGGARPGLIKQAALSYRHGLVTSGVTGETTREMVPYVCAPKGSEQFWALYGDLRSGSEYEILSPLQMLAECAE